MSLAAEPRKLLDLDPSADNPRNSEGAFLIEGEGRLAFAYTHFTGGARDNSAGHIAMRRSADGGRTWSADAVLVENEGAENVMSVSITRLPSGEALLFYIVKNGWHDLHPVVRRSGDGLRTLSAPVRVINEPGYFVVNNDRVVRLANGRLLLPAALHPCADGTRATWSGRGTVVVYLSDDDGRTWQPAPSRLTPPGNSGDAGFQEPGVVELHEGLVGMFIRTKSGFLWQSYSSDGGENWAAPVATPLASPLSPASVKRVPSTGDLLLVWNDHSGRHPFVAGKRTPLCTAISKDEGRSWSPSRVLEGDPESWYCYTAIDFDGDRVLLAYCAGTEAIGRLSRTRITAVPVGWLYA